MSESEYILSEFSTPIDADFERTFARAAHVQYVLNLNKHTETIEFQATEHLRLSAIYWAMMAMDLVGALHRMDRAGILAFVDQCRDSATGAYGGNAGHDPHLLHTLSALQILAMFDALERADAPRVAAYIASLQRPDGSFVGDQWGEIDTRFSYCALNALALLNALPSAETTAAARTAQQAGSSAGDNAPEAAPATTPKTAAEAAATVDVAQAVRFIANCRNFDGGFGAVPGAESHSGQIFCCVGALAIADAVDANADRDALGWWLCERQLPCGGFNGRPEKKEDVCYSWWVLSSLSALNRLAWIDRPALAQFILGAQDPADGGISDRPDCMTDVYHTYFGIAGLSLLGYPGLEKVDPIYALPVKTVRRLGLRRAAYAE